MKIFSHLCSHPCLWSPTIFFSGPILVHSVKQKLTASGTKLLPKQMKTWRFSLIRPCPLKSVLSGIEFSALHSPFPISSYQGLQSNRWSSHSGCLWDLDPQVLGMGTVSGRILFSPHLNHLFSLVKMGPLFTKWSTLICCLVFWKNLSRWKS